MVQWLGLAALLRLHVVSNHIARLALATLFAAALVAESLMWLSPRLTLRLRDGDWWQFVKMSSCRSS